MPNLEGTGAMGFYWILMWVVVLLDRFAVFLGGISMSMRASPCICLLVLLRFYYTALQEWIGCYPESGQPNIPI
jgi:hypothetical protein